MNDDEEEFDEEEFDEEEGCLHCGELECNCDLKCYECGNVITDQFDHNRDCSFSPEYVRPA